MRLGIILLFVLLSMFGVGLYHQRVNIEPANIEKLISTIEGEIPPGTALKLGDEHYHRVMALKAKVSIVKQLDEQLVGLRREMRKRQEDPGYPGYKIELAKIVPVSVNPTMPDLRLTDETKEEVIRRVHSRVSGVTVADTVALQRAKERIDLAELEAEKIRCIALHEMLKHQAKLQKMEIDRQSEEMELKQREVKNKILAAEIEGIKLLAEKVKLTGESEKKKK